jgi:electron transfer flavoprotein beta subunit
VKILVTVKLVPDTTAEKRIDPATKHLVRAGVETELNPFDAYAIEAGLQVRDALADGSTVTIFSMGPESGREIVRKALAMGADDAVMLCDPALAGSDLWATATVMAQAITLVGFDLVLTGTQSTDAISGVLPGMLAEYLGVPALTYARELTIDGTTLRVKRETESGYQTLRTQLPALASVTKSANEPRYPSLKGIMGAKKKDIRTLGLADLPVTRAAGGDGARVEVLSLATPPARERGRTVTAVDGPSGAAAIVDFLKARQLL